MLRQRSLRWQPCGGSTRVAGAPQRSVVRRAFKRGQQQQGRPGFPAYPGYQLPPVNPNQQTPPPQAPPQQQPAAPGNGTATPPRPPMPAGNPQQQQPQQPRAPQPSEQQPLQRPAYQQRPGFNTQQPMYPPNPAAAPPQPPAAPPAQAPAGLPPVQNPNQTWQQQNPAVGQPGFDATQAAGFAAAPPAASPAPFQMLPQAPSNAGQQQQQGGGMVQPPQQGEFINSPPLQGMQQQPGFINPPPQQGMQQQPGFINPPPQQGMQQQPGWQQQPQQWQQQQRQQGGGNYPLDPAFDLGIDQGGYMDASGRVNPGDTGGYMNAPRRGSGWNQEGNSSGYYRNNRQQQQQQRQQQQSNYAGGYLSDYNLGPQQQRRMGFTGFEQSTWAEDYLLKQLDARITPSNMVPLDGWVDEVEVEEDLTPKYVNGRRVLVNSEIEVPRVRAQDATGGELGVMSFDQARELANSQNADVVMINEDGEPPVVRLVAFSKYKYELEKGAKKKQKASKAPEIKEVKLRPVTEKADYDTKVKQAQKFLSKGAKVKLTMTFSGREMRFKDQGKEMMLKLIEELSTTAKLEAPLALRPSNFSVTLVPLK